MKNFYSLHTFFLAAAAFLFASALPVKANDTAFTVIPLRDAPGANSFHLEATGDVVSEVLQTEMGSFKESFAVRTLSRKGAELRFDLPVSKEAASVILEIQEIHNRRPDAFGYTVLINGEEVYFRTYQELGAGPNHYFVEVPKGLLHEGSPLKICLRHEGGGPLSIGRVWAYENFFERVAKLEGFSKPMGILFPTSSIRIEGEEKKKKGAEAELERLKEMKRLFSGFRDYAPVGFMTFAGGYGQGDPDQGRKALLEKAVFSSELGMPALWIVNGTGWGGKPTCADGQGGFFSDIQYTRTVYDASLGTYRASWPNMWGNTPGTALRNPVMNAFIERRFQKMFEDFQQQLALMRLDGKPAQPILVREFAPASGEISQAVIEEAVKDGLDLNPADGMSTGERLWMHRNAVKTWKEFAESTTEAAGRDVVIVDHGKVELPQEQLFDNLYSHPDFLTDSPMNDPRWGGGQHGMVDGLWSSGEMGTGVNYRDVAMYDYLRARGKLSMINMERTILKEDFSVMKRHYERGFQFLCFFNADPGDEKFVKSVDGIADEPMDPPVHRQPDLLDVIVSRDLTAGPKENVVGVKNIKVHHELRLAVEDVTRPGEILYRLENAGLPFETGLALDMDGRISPGRDNQTEVYVGQNPDRLKKVATLTAKDLPDPDHWTPNMTSRALVDLGNSMIGKKETFVRLVFHAAGAPDAAFLLALNVQSQWLKHSGYAGKPSLTKGQARTLQLWVQERGICQRLLEKYRNAGGGKDDVYRKASDLFERGWYHSANRLLSAEISQLLPATYLVRGQGPLGKYPIDLKLENPEDCLFATVEQFAPGKIILALKSVRETQPCTLEVRSVDAGRRWTLRPLENGRYELAQEEKGATVVADGKVRFALMHHNPEKPARKLPSQIFARYLGGNKNRIQVDVQDLELMNYMSQISLPLANNAFFTRKAAGQENAEIAGTTGMPDKLDAVALTLSAAGEVTAVESRYGYEKGRIKAFYPPVVVGKPSNGVIEMESGNKYELMFDKAATIFNTVALQGTLVAYEIPTLKDAIKPGQQIELRYTPNTGACGLPRLLHVKQERDLLLDVDYTKDMEWRKAVSRITGLDVRPHKPEPNYLYRVEMPLLRPLEAFKPGSVVYHFPQREKPLGETVVEVAARAFEDSSRVTFYVSADGKKWTRCGQFDNTWQNSYSQNLQNLPYQFIDLTPAVQGLTSFYLKIELAVNSADHRFCVAKLRVSTEK